MTSPTNRCRGSTGSRGGPGPRSAAAVTVPMLEYAQPEGVDGRGPLLELAARIRADARPDPEPGPLLYAHTVTEQWEVERVLGLEDTLAPYRREETTWVDLATGTRHADVLVNERPLEHVELELPDADAVAVMWAPVDLSGTAGELTARLTERGGSSPAGMLLGQYAAAAQRGGAYAGEERATFFEALAEAGGVLAYGEVTDRAGRTGLAFGVTDPDLEGWPGYDAEHRVIVDPDTGVVLASEHIVTDVADQPVETVGSYTLVLESGYAGGMPDHPEVSW